jgi:hypothetical protein
MAASPLTPVSLAAPGFFGLNTQEASVNVQQNFALIANNAVIDTYGRVGARKGYTTLSDADADDIIYCVHEHINKDGTEQVYFVGGSQIYTMATDGTTASDHTIASPPADSNWQPLSFNGNMYLFHEGVDPLVNDIVGATGWNTLSSFSAMPTGVTQAGVGLSAYGRIWMARTNLNKTTVYWSDTLIGTSFNTGTAGSIDLENVFTNGTDEITHLAAFNGFLVIFCKKSVIIYKGAEEPATMAVEDVIDGVGCIARDTVQDIGSDILFLSDSGLRSLGRIIQEKSAPMRDLSRNVRDQLLAEVSGEGGIIKSTYYEKEAFYLLTVPNLQKVWCFDIRSALEDGSFRVTTWTSPNLNSFCVTRSRKLLVGTSLRVSEFGGYTDNGSPYTMSYYTTYLDAGAPSNLKMLKDASFLFVGGSGETFSVKWDVDYGSNYASKVFSFPTSATGEFGVDEYTVAEYSVGAIINRKGITLSKTGRVFQLGVEVVVNGSPLSIQQIDIFVKGGRTV